jgi:hypothetical protein
MNKFFSIFSFLLFLIACTNSKKVSISKENIKTIALDTNKLNIRGSRASKDYIWVNDTVRYIGVNGKLILDTIHKH